MYKEPTWGKAFACLRPRKKGHVAGIQWVTRSVACNEFPEIEILIHARGQ